MPGKFDRFSVISRFKTWKLPAIAAAVLAPTTLIALPSIALMSQGRVFFNTPPVLVRAGATNTSAKQPSIYEFYVRVPQNAGEPLRALKITQRPNTDAILLDQSQVRAQTVGEVRLASSVDPQSSLDSSRMPSSANSSGAMQSSSSMSSSTADSMQPSESSTGAISSAPAGEPQTPTSEGMQSPTGATSGTSTSRSRTTLDPQYYSYDAVRARATQSTYTGPTQPNNTGSAQMTSDSSVSQTGSRDSNPKANSNTTGQDYRRLSESEARAYRADARISPREYAMQEAKAQDGRKLTLASVGGDDLSSGEAVVQFDPPVAPGTTVRVTVPAIANPQSGGTYLFGVTAYPAGDNSYGQFLGYSQIRFYQN